jgi:hypothetical protein
VDVYLGLVIELVKSHNTCSQAGVSRHDTVSTIVERWAMSQLLVIAMQYYLVATCYC